MNVRVSLEKDIDINVVVSAVEIVKKVQSIVFDTNNFVKPPKYDIDLYDTDLVSDKNFVFTFDYEFKDSTTLKQMKMFNKLVIDFLTNAGIEIIPDLDSTLERPILDCYF